MKIAAVDGVGPSPRGHAYGLVRQLQEGTFKGASVEKHRALYADRLKEQEETAPVHLDESNVPASGGDAPDVVSIDSPVQPVAPETVTVFGGLGTYVDARV
jgi:hypothetical protein